MTNPERGHIHEYPFLNELDHEDLIELLPYLNEYEHPKGTLLLEKGKVSRELHMVLSGKVAIRIENVGDGSSARLERGQFFGDWSCLTGEPAQADYRAEENVRTLSISRTGMQKLMDRCPGFRERMIEALFKRMGKALAGSFERPARSPFALRQLNEIREMRAGPLVGSSFCMQTIRHRIPLLAAGDELICITGEKGVGKFHIASEIHYRSDRGLQPLVSVDANHYDPQDWEMKVRMAEGGTMIVEHADLFPAALLHRLIRSAEHSRIIMTGRTLPDVVAQHVEVAPLRDRPEDIPELVYACLKKAGMAAPETSITEEAMRMLSMFPYRGDNIDGLRRIVKNALARSGGNTIRGSHLRFDRVREPGARPTVGLALGSGSVRGAAHVGVIKALEEEQIPIDLIAGSSAGAFIGALYAGGQSIPAFENVLPTVRWRHLVNLAKPPRAIADNRKMVQFIEQYIGPVNFEDLPIPFAIMAADASTGEGCILNAGRVSEAVCASTAIPGIMKPVRYRDRLLIDGGVVHPVPVLLARSMGADIVIAVDLSSSSYTKRFPKNIVASILNTIEIMSDHILREELQLADFVLNPQLDIHDSTFKSSAAYIRRGVEVTRVMVPAIKRKIYAATADSEQV